MTLWFNLYCNNQTQALVVRQFSLLHTVVTKVTKKLNDLEEDDIKECNFVVHCILILILFWLRLGLSNPL